MVADIKHIETGLISIAVNQEKNALIFSLDEKPVIRLNLEEWNQAENLKRYITFNNETIQEGRGFDLAKEFVIANQRHKFVEMEEMLKIKRENLDPIQFTLASMDGMIKSVKEEVEQLLEEIKEDQEVQELFEETENFSRNASQKFSGMALFILIPQDP